MNMDATHPIRVVLFWDLEHARDAYDPYFTGSAKKTIRYNIAKEGIHVLVEFELIQSQTYFELHNTSISNISEHVTAITQMVSDKPSMLYPSVDEDDDDNDYSDKDYTVSSESYDDNNPDDEKDGISTLVNPVISTTMNQWQSNQ
ncbi:hypothetical protein M9H77_01828 [Catharanthus roseus]|uniref:Uncharacterized protein n=1 Tax=Catharanthus roseus TaxID=4058 RepID=A0ACC0C6Q4_CATRO|nr:hypothetical protein M9H77_01828 [Catharanthus roseus]